MRKKIVVGIAIAASAVGGLLLAPRIARSDNHQRQSGDGVGFVGFSCDIRFIPAGQAGNSCPPGQDFQSAMLQASVMAAGVAGIGSPTATSSPFPPNVNCFPAGTATLPTSYCTTAVHAATMNDCDIVASDDQVLPQPDGSFSAAAQIFQHCFGNQDFLVGTFERAVRVVYGLAPHPRRPTP
jgi:hypothetical protein